VELWRAALQRYTRDRPDRAAATRGARVIAVRLARAQFTGDPLGGAASSAPARPPRRSPRSPGTEYFVQPPQNPLTIRRRPSRRRAVRRPRERRLAPIHRRMYARTAATERISIASIRIVRRYHPAGSSASRWPAAAAWPRELGRAAGVAAEVQFAEGRAAPLVAAEDGSLERRGQPVSVHVPSRTTPAPTFLLACRNGGNPGVRAKGGGVLAGNENVRPSRMRARGAALEARERTVRARVDAHRHLSLADSGTPPGTAFAWTPPAAVRSNIYCTGVLPPPRTLLTYAAL